MIDTLLSTPYEPGGSSLSGADCWGVVELWYHHVLGVALPDRSAHPAGHDGMQAGFEAAQDWEQIDKPEDHCLVIMRAGRLNAGHVGIFYGGFVLHTDKSHGCVYEAISKPMIRAKTTCYLRHRSYHDRNSNTPQHRTAGDG